MWRATQPVLCAPWSMHRDSALQCDEWVRVSDSRNKIFGTPPRLNRLLPLSFCIKDALLTLPVAVFASRSHKAGHFSTPRIQQFLYISAFAMRKVSLPHKWQNPECSIYVYFVAGLRCWDCRCCINFRFGEITVLCTHQCATAQRLCPPSRPQSYGPPHSDSRIKQPLKV